MRTLTRISPISCITLGLVLISLLVMPTSGVLSQAQSGRDTSQEQPTAANNYGFSEVTPSGDWVVYADFDISQSNDSMPVVPVGIRMYNGKGAWGKQLMVESVTLQNQTQKVVQEVKLGWIILFEHDRNAGKNREAALVEGYSKPLKLESFSGRFKKLKSVRIDFVKEAKSLLRNGSLNGSFYIRVRISEVYFSDGSVWKEDDFIASRTTLYSHSKKTTFTSHLRKH